MAAVIKECFQEALKLANASEYHKSFTKTTKKILTLPKTVLKFEPTNATIQEYLPILQELILLEKEGPPTTSSSTFTSFF